MEALDGVLSKAWPAGPEGAGSAEAAPRLGAPQDGSAHALADGAAAGPEAYAASLRRQIDDWIQPLRTVSGTRLDRELGERLGRVAPLRHCLCVLRDHACAGLEPLAPRLHGTLGPDLTRVYGALLVDHDPLLHRAAQEWGALIGTIEEHALWIRQHMRNADVILAWLARAGADGAAHLAVVPARGWLTRGAVLAFFAQRPADAGVFALFYAAQRLATTLELRDRPFIAELLAMRFTAREIDVLRAGLQGAGDEAIALRLGLTIDAIRYYFKKFKHAVPPTLGHLKPRELARILHQLGKL